MSWSTRLSINWKIYKKHKVKACHSFISVTMSLFLDKIFQLWSYLINFRGSKGIHLTTPDVLRYAFELISYNLAFFFLLLSNIHMSFLSKWRICFEVSDSYYCGHILSNKNILSVSFKSGESLKVPH